MNLHPEIEMHDVQFLSIPQGDAKVNLPKSNRIFSLRLRANNLIFFMNNRAISELYHYRNSMPREIFIKYDY